MVIVVQLVERQIVVLVVAGSSPVGHPKGCVLEASLVAGILVANDARSNRLLL